MSDRVQKYVCASVERLDPCSDQADRGLECVVYLAADIEPHDAALRDECARLRAQLAAIKDTVGEENWSLRQHVATLQEEVTKLEKMLYPGGV